MLTMRDGPLLKAVAEVIKDHVGKAFAVLRGEIDGLEQRFNDIPQPVSGPPGPPGPSGEKGTDGASGIQGDVGPAGKDGAPGRDGTDGKDGIQGIAGKDGADGLNGKDGAPGTSGKDGKDGINGKAGEPGPEGKKGHDGKDGLQGPPGIDGLVGKDGRDGIDGKDGAPGANGKDGADGINGKDGSNGLDGKNGADGTNGKDGGDGIDGKNGVDGINGKDADPVDTAALTDAITQKVLAQIPPPIQGKDGKDGINGNNGVDGLNGKDGKDGINGNNGVDGLNGKDGKDGINGKDVDLEHIRALITGEVTKAIGALPKPAAGRDGRDGRQGETGRDALDLDILPAIDESMSYQRGILAQHRNGLFRAYRTTDPVQGNDYEAAGWMCIVRGVHDIVQALEADQRTVITSFELSDGKLITSDFTTPTLVDKGTWKTGVDYQKGDTVTVAGSLWICQSNSQDRPGTSGAWRLAVKRGSDGKDLRPAEELNLDGSHKRGEVYLSQAKS